MMYGFAVRNQRRPMPLSHDRPSRPSSRFSGQSNLPRSVRAMSDPMFLDGAASSAGQVPVFYIPCTRSLQEGLPRTLKHGDTFAVFDHNGDILQGPGSPEGLFHADTRHMSLCRLTLDCELGLCFRTARECCRGGDKSPFGIVARSVPLKRQKPHSGATHWPGSAGSPTSQGGGMISDN